MRMVALLLLAGCDQTWNLDRVPRVDAGPPDARFDPAADCPMDYQLALHPGSRYRITPDSFAAWDVSADCSDDRDGATHLAVAQTRAELDALIQAIGPTGIGRWWIGAVQTSAAVQPGGSWIWVTGEPIDPALWDAPGEPNDGDGSEDHVEDFGFIESIAPGLVDYAAGFGMRALCECDGRAMDAEAQNAILLLKQ